MSSMRFIKTIITSFLLLLSVISQQAFASACCGGAISIPTLITGDDRGILTTTISRSELDTFVNSDGIWRKNDSADITGLLRIDSAHIFLDRFQIGFSLPVQNRIKSGLNGGESFGLSDVSGQVGYEYLPSWEYSPWIPHGVGYLSVVAPTGKSIYDDSGGGADISGRGLWAFGVGTVLTKYWVSWDVVATLEAHHYLDRTVNNSQYNGTVHAGSGLSYSLGVGYNLQNYRAGAAIAWLFDDPISVRGAGAISNGSAQRFATGTFSVSRLLPEQMGITVSYSDQTLFGDPSNSGLSKSVLVSIQKKWER